MVQITAKMAEFQTFWFMKWWRWRPLANEIENCISCCILNY